MYTKAQILEAMRAVDVAKGTNQFSDATEEDIFLCSPENPWTQEIVDYGLYLATFHPNVKNEICPDCGINMTKLQ